MVWLAFGVGLAVGAALGVFVTGLCRAISDYGLRMPDYECVDECPEKVEPSR